MQAAMGLLRCTLLLEGLIDLTELFLAQARRDLVRIAPTYFNKLKIVAQSFCHV